MRQFLLILAASGCLISCTNSPNSVMNKATHQWPQAVIAPVAEKKANNIPLHGDTLKDDYYWMNAYFKKTADSGKVVQYLVEENRYTDTMMSGVRQLRDELFIEMKGRIKEKDESVPVLRNGYYYYTRNEQGKEYYKYCRKKGNLDAPEEILLDVDEMAKGHTYFSVAGFNVSPDSKLIAYGVDTVSRRQYVIQVKNLETGALLSDKIFPTTGDVTWANDNKTFFYTVTNPVTLLTEKINRHQLGADPARDVVVYEEKDNSNYIGVSKTRSKNYIVIQSRATLSSECRVLDANNPRGAFTVVQSRMKDVLYDVDHWGDKFLLVTNWNAKNFRLMETPLTKTDSSNWKEVIPHRASVFLEGIDVFKNYWVITERKEGLLQLRIQNKTNDQEHYLDFGEAAYTAYVGSNAEFNTDIMRYGYTSLTTPNSTYDYNMATKDRKLLKQQEIVGGYDVKSFTTERLYATATDGTLVPISLVYKKGMAKDGKAPLLLYGYGSYGASMDASFSSARLSLLDRGFVFAIAHIRGGQEMGRHWYEDGKLMKKKNTFTDFIDCAEFLIKQQFTSKEHLYAQGGSAGGLLMGAITNMRPDLWNGVVAQVPFVDVINTMLDESIPLTTTEFDEWGNPKNKEAYAYMKSYSPYDNVAKKDYPNLLVTTGLHDSQVQYFEPAKWVAKLRAMKTDKSLLLLHTNMEVGHGGASGRFDFLKDVALVYGFILSLEGITK
jgi:oligopeptidase B